MSCILIGRYEALESRMDSLRAEKRSSRDPTPHIVQKHLEEVAERERQIASLQVCHSRAQDWTLILHCLCCLAEEQKGTRGNALDSRGSIHCAEQAIYPVS